MTNDGQRERVLRGEKERGGIDECSGRTINGKGLERVGEGNSEGKEETLCCSRKKMENVYGDTKGVEVGNGERVVT